MTAKSPFSFSRASAADQIPILPLHNPRQSSQASEYDLDELEPRADDHLLSGEFNHGDVSTRTDFNTAFKPSSSNRKPTGARNRRPSNASSAGSASKTRRPHDRDPPLFFHGPPPPIAVSRVLYRDEEQRQRYYNDDDDGESPGIAASWLPSFTAAKAITSVLKDVRGNPGARRGYVEQQPIAYDRNAVWKGLARRQRAIVADVRWFLEVLEEEALNKGASDDVGGGSDGAATPTGAASASTLSSRHPGRSVSFLEPESRAGPNGEIVPVRQPRKTRLGIRGARKGILRSLAELSDIKAEEDASLAAALSNRKQALWTLRKLASRQEGIVEELRALEVDKEEPSKLELEDLDNEHRGVCREIQDLEKRLKALKSRRRYLEDRLDNVKNQREAGLSGYKNALKEVESTVKDFLTSPPVKPLDVMALNENNEDDREQPAPTGGVEFMRLRPERRTLDMAREWWESEVAILETRQGYVDKERLALEEGGQVWDEVMAIIHQCEDDLRKDMAASMAESKGKSKASEVSREETLKLQHEKIVGVVTGLEERMRIVEQEGWKLLETALGIELLAFKAAAQESKEMLQAAGISLDEKRLASPSVPRDESGTTASHNSFHTVDNGSDSEPLDLPNNHEDEVVDSDNEIPQDLLGTHDQEDIKHEREEKDDHDKTQTTITSFDGHNSDNDVPPELLVEQNDGRM
ncbi:unnamed protein product [Discula destructiva]